jgi:putative sterol carrier protein
MEDANSAIFALIAPPDAGKKETGDRKSAGPDVKSIFGKMTEAFKPEAAKDVDAVFQYVISGSGGGNWFVTVKDSKCNVTEGTAEKPTCTLKISDGDFVELITGKLNPMQAFTSGKLKIEGDIMKSQLIGKLFILN